jgi:hypothetical protein
LTIVASRLAHAASSCSAAQIPCDGFNIGIDHPANFRRVVDEVVPLLQERGVLREDYDSTLLRGHLGLPVPENRYTAARAVLSPVV